MDSERIMNNTHIIDGSLCLVVPPAFILLKRFSPCLSSATADSQGSSQFTAKYTMHKNMSVWDKVNWLQQGRLFSREGCLPSIPDTVFTSVYWYSVTSVYLVPSPMVSSSVPIYIFLDIWVAAIHSDCKNKTWPMLHTMVR